VAESGFGSARHLGHRFAGSLRPGGPGARDEAWARSFLTEREQALWARMSGPDRRHAVGVGRRVATFDLAVVPAALLHDVGKVESGFGPFRRAVTTAIAVAVGRERMTGGPGRMSRYLRHDSLGAALLEAAASDHLTIAWAREHHLPDNHWTLPHHLGAALKAADDD
jgi:hypothetical protein